MHKPSSNTPRFWEVDIAYFPDPSPHAVLIARDSYTGTVIALPVAPKSSVVGDVLRLLDRIAKEHGVPNQIHTDKSRTFANGDVRNWLKGRQVNHVLFSSTSPLRGSHDRALHRGAQRASVSTPLRKPTQHTNQANSPGTLKADRAAVANWAVHTLAVRVRKEGAFTPPTPAIPASIWEMNSGEVRVHLADGLLLLPDDPELSVLLDVWPGERARKCLSVSWMPSRPWLPPRLVSFKSGPWLGTLDFSSLELGAHPL
jgi:hypothetical protein